MPLTELEETITKSVLSPFLRCREFTPRRALINAFKASAPEAIGRLVNCAVLQHLAGNNLVPRLLAFHYCADESTLFKAKKSVEIVLSVLRSFYEENVDELSRGQIEERARRMFNLIEPEGIIGLGLYLAQDFGVFASGGSLIEITALRMTESIITIEGDIDGAWEAYVRRMSKYLERGGGSEEEKALAMRPDSAKRDASANEGILVLISHSSIDVPLALALIHLLRLGLGLGASQIRCSSVDGYRLPAGVNNLLRTEYEINQQYRPVLEAVLYERG